MSNPETPRQTFASGSNRTWWNLPPVDDALSQVKDGHPMDAGTWTIVQQNVNVALDIAPRQLVQSAPGGGLTTITQPTSGGWYQLLEDFLGASERTADVTNISWGLRDGGGAITAERHGPVNLLRDRNDGYGHFALRRIRARAEVESSSANHFSVGFAVTGGPSPPTEGYLYWSGWQINDTATFKHMKWTATFGETGSYTMPSGAIGTVGGIASFDAVYLWWGFKHDGTGTHKVHALSAYEWVGSSP